ncbi:hypothetical protein GCM10010218_03200 [Streptomyces mashuensis]|uniref:DUF1453 domain-containing protein n=1 Tax=Streptomyces mashuensis TaxID=33904 RepID=A0A919E8W7_9ACTN|nr:DUF1453 domain-containing protein [Streptomyces mashuensis]GHF25855.1 hypothetical protein GCM10010218_03200 [Streptomyces mashuensis]
MNIWLLAGVIAVVVVIVVVKRLAGEPLDARDLFGPALVLTAIGTWTVVRNEAGLTGTDLAWTVSGAVLGLALGAARGATVRVFEKEGVLWQRYTGRTFLVLAVSLAVMAGFGWLAARGGMHEGARPVQLSIGVGFLGEALVVGARGLATGVPFATRASRRS